MILANVTNIHNPTNNPILDRIKKRKLNSIQNTTTSKNYLNNFAIKINTEFELINNLKQIFECTFIPDTVFKFIANEYFIGLKCMVIKDRDEQLECDNPDRHLEWDTLYSEFKEEFHIVYILYNPICGKMFMNIGTQIENIKEIISGIELNKENKKHLNTCIKLFRQMYVKKNFEL